MVRADSTTNAIVPDEHLPGGWLYALAMSEMGVEYKGVVLENDFEVGDPSDLTREVLVADQLQTVRASVRELVVTGC
jgi:hypothetical protein